MPTARTMRIFADNMKRLRASHGYTCQQVADGIGATPGQVSRLENARRFVGPEVVDRIADFYQVAIADLFNPQKGAEKSFSIAATKEHALDVVNGMVQNGRLKLKFVHTND